MGGFIGCARNRYTVPLCSIKIQYWISEINPEINPNGSNQGRIQKYGLGAKGGIWWKDVPSPVDFGTVPQEKFKSTVAEMQF